MRARPISPSILKPACTSAARGELPNDGLLQDNTRYAAVEVRDRVPVLLIDGLGGYKPRRGESR